MPPSPTTLLALSAALDPGPEAPSEQDRLFSIWEITSWILPMAPEHFRRVLAANPDLPQGVAGSEGGTRWFSAEDLGALRGHFAQGVRGGRYRPLRPEGAKAPLIALAGPSGGSGRSTALAHLATAAGLSGWRVLVIDTDPGGRQAALLGARGPRFRSETPTLSGPLALIGRAAARHLQRMNAARLDLGEPPLPMDDRLSVAQTVSLDSLLLPTRWPGVELLAPAPGEGLLADPLIAAWRLAQRSWQPWRVLAEALEEAGLRQRYDLILCDTGRGLGPMALSALISADVLLAPLPLSGPAARDPAVGLAALAAAVSQTQAEGQALARALGQAGPVHDWRRLAILPTRSGATGAEGLAGFAAKLGGLLTGGVELLPAVLPEIAEIAQGRVGQLYDLDYRQRGRLAYAPDRDACEAAFRGLAGLIAGLWQEDKSAQPALL